MTPDHLKKNRSSPALTLVLVAVLLLIRISPVYYAAQFVPVRHGDTHSMPVVGRADNQCGTLRCQRAISERIQVIAVPQIRFTGTPFTAFFAGLIGDNVDRAPFSFFGGVILSNAQRVAQLRNLRL